MRLTDGHGVLRAGSHGAFSVFRVIFQRGSEHSAPDPAAAAAAGLRCCPRVAAVHRQGTRPWRRRSPEYHRGRRRMRALPASYGRRTARGLQGAAPRGLEPRRDQAGVAAVAWSH
jgi:hypothetical protein